MRLDRFASQLLAILTACLLAGALGACGSSSSQPASLPHDELRLVTDTLGITHVYAKSDRDAFYGGGYAQARDRLFHMELNRRKALGRLAELFGMASLGEDRQARVIGFGRLGEADAALMKKERPEDYALAEAWVAGVNARIAEVKSGKAPRPYGLGPDELDFVPEPWTVAQSLAVGKMLVFGLSNTLDRDLLATVLLNIAKVPAEHLPVSKPAYDTFVLPLPAGANGASPSGASSPLPPKPTSTPPGPLPPADQWRFFADPFASNNWAVAGKHTENGRPLLCGDPHQLLSSPQNFWPVHLSSVASEANPDGAGTLDVVGFIFPGTPAVELGHNGHIGWTATTNFADVMDLWETDFEDADHISLGDGTHAIVTAEETIHVRRDGEPVGNNDDVVQQTMTVPGYGILLPDEILPVQRAFIARGQILFNWTGFQATREGSAFLAFDRAKNLDDFEHAVDLLNVGALNFVAADQSGIAYRSHALVPDRGDPKSRPMPWHMMDGSDAQTLWTGKYLPDDKLPYLRNPDKGYIVTANNDPWGFTADGDVQNDPWYYGAFFANGMRAHRIVEALDGLLTGGAKVSRDDMARLQADVHSDMADTLVPLLDQAMAALDSDPKLAAWKDRDDLRALATALDGWDRDMALDSKGAVMFTAWQWFAAQRAFQEKFTVSLFDTITNNSPPFMLGMLRNLVTGRVADADQFIPDGVSALLVGALADTADWLTARYGDFTTADFKYGDINVAVFTNRYHHKLDSAPVSVAGGNDTILVDEAAFFDKGQPRNLVQSNEMSLYRMAIQFADDGTPEAVLDFARGVNENPGDKHFDDQEALWVQGGHVPLPFRPADVTAAKESEVTLPAVK